MTDEPAMFSPIDGVEIAFRKRDGAGPGLVWLGGYRSDMKGTKAETLDQWTVANGRAFLRHDYSGHGESGGEFRDGTISRWLAQSLGLFRQQTKGPQILIGSSMGAWIALRMIAELQKAGEGARVGGLILLAPAPDFTRELLAPRLSEAQKREWAEKGVLEVPSEYDVNPYIYTRALFEDGANNYVMTGPIDTHCPVTILQGLADPDVPYQHALNLASLMPADDVTMSLIPDGDHRLSRPQDLALLVSAVEEISARISA